MMDILIRYVLISDSKRSNQASFIHLLRDDDINLLRCFMTLFLLPTGISDLRDEGKPFSTAVNRIIYLPRFRRASSKGKPPAEIVKGTASSPLVVFMANSPLPSWVVDLSASRDIGLLTPSPKLAKQLSGFGRIHTGTLIEGNDLREAYRVLRELLSAASANSSYESSVRSTFERLAMEDLFANRPRLGFIPPIPLPAPGDGRPAVYLLNRLSNSVEEPSLLAGPTDSGSARFPQLLRAYKMACAALALLESGQAIPDEARVTKSELQQHHAFLTSAAAEDKQKDKRLLELGWQLSDGKWSEQSFLTIPVPRLDLVRGKTPTSFTKRPGHNLQAGTALRAVKDLMRGRTSTSFKTEAQKRIYTDTQWTMQTEQRLLACQSAWLGGMTHTIPTQLEPLPGELYSQLQILDSALKTDSRKIPNLFRRVELLLSKALPEGFPEFLSEGVTGVTLHSDLPFEWTLIGEWPLCLTRPVSRIPVGLTHWDVLSAALERPFRIDANKPEAVLVLDLIQSHDAIREDSDAFIASSASLGQHYTYASPRTAQEFRHALTNVAPSIVVLDAHGSYDRTEDKLFINLKGTPVLLDDLLGDSILPPIWMLSACETSVVGAMRGCFVRRLLARGAVCVVATLSRIDAFIASMFIGRLLTDIFNPTLPPSHRTLEEVFFFTQSTTALAYDPLLPLFRRAGRDSVVKHRLAQLLSDFFNWVSGQVIDIRKFRTDVALFLNERMEQHGLIALQQAALQGGLVRPETLLFTCFGVPRHISIE